LQGSDLLLAGLFGCGYPSGVATFGENLKHERERLGISQEKLAQKLGVRQAQVSAWEQSRRRPTPDSIQRIAAAIGCQPSVLLAGVMTEIDTLRGAKAPTAPRSRVQLLTLSEKKLLRVFREMNEEGQALALDQMKRMAPSFPPLPLQESREPQSDTPQATTRKGHGKR
jgi:transcriptional regulator with XRE-family HTH domain